eukprot:3340835-Ditylum_brightwellii.AAC.1
MELDPWTSKIDPATAMYIQNKMCMFKRRIVEHISGACGQANDNMSALSMHMAPQKYWQAIPPNDKPSPDQI